ncbi:MAG: esterase/lipase family protein [Kiloniellaceae bacterium]
MRPVNHRRLALALAVLMLVACGVQLNRTQLWEDRQIHAGWRLQQHIVLHSCRLLDRGQAVRARGWGDDCAGALAAARREQGLAPASGHLVLLLHGMGRSTFLFRDMERELRAAGYEAVAISYPSLTKDIAGHADQLTVLLESLEGVERVSFVTHSLGALVVREALSRPAPWRGRLALGRVVMLAPPNQGSRLAAALQKVPAYHWIGGPAAGEIAAGPPFAPLPVGIEVAVIAGGTADGRGFNPLLPDNNDGIVTIAETALPGVRDRMTVSAVHTVIAAAPETIAATRRFLENGRLR